MNCILQTYDPVAARKMTFTDRIIRLRSYHTHSEYQFSERYGHISFSATLRDGCKCARFKQIDYTKHPKRWKSIIIPMTDLEEDYAWQVACEMADMNNTMVSLMLDAGKTNVCFFGHNAIPYDIWGMGCHISATLKWWQPNPKKTWCSKAVSKLLFAAFGVARFPELWDLRDEIMPTPLYDLAGEYF